MGMFPSTSLELLKRLAAEVTGRYDASWERFFALYTPAIRRFVELNDSTHDPDDVVQDVYLQLVKVLRAGKYKPEKARFRTFLAMLIRRQLISLYRKENARGRVNFVPFEELESDPIVDPSQGEELDLCWARARHDAVVSHILTKTALSDQSKRVYKAFLSGGKTLKEIAAENGISENLVRQIKFRVDKRIEILEEEIDG